MGILDWLPCCGSRRKEDDLEHGPTDRDPLLPPSNREGSLQLALGGTDGSTYGAADSLNGESREREGMSKEQRRRIEEIGREAGSQMLSIHRTRNPRNVSSTSAAPSHSNSPAPQPSSSRSARHPGPSRDIAPSHIHNPTPTSTSDTLNPTASSPSATATSSRPSSPSPSRPMTSPPGGTMRSIPASERTAGSARGRSRRDSDDVTREDGEGDADADGIGPDGDAARDGEAGGNGDGQGEVVRKQVFGGNAPRGRGRGRGRGKGKGRGRGK